MAEDNEDERQFFKDLGATAEQTEYILKYLQSFAAQAKDFSDTYTKMATGAIKAPSL
jgi:hypothetical protein